MNNVLIEGIYFSNGIALSDDEEFIVIAETGKSKIWNEFPFYVNKL